MEGGRSSDLTDQKELHTNNLDIRLAFFIAAMVSMIIPLPIAAGPSDNDNSNASTPTSLLVAYAQPSEDNGIITAHLDEPFQLRINQTAIIMPDNMSIRFLDVLDDSRCPTSVACVWPGQVTISVNVTESFPGFSSVLNLTLGPSNSNLSTNVDSHIIEILDVEPYPVRERGIPKGDYRATIMALPPRPIPTGEWDIVSNGLHGTLNITSIDREGRLNGTVLLYPFDTPPNEINGYIDRESGKVTFVRVMGPGPLDIEVYTGYIFSNVIADCVSGTGPGSCYDYARMAGTFESFYAGGSNTNDTSTLIGTFGDAKRNTFGWFASHVPQPCPACPS
jgi:hypothetical protein